MYVMMMLIFLLLGMAVADGNEGERVSRWCGELIDNPSCWTLGRITNGSCTECAPCAAFSVDRTLVWVPCNIILVASTNNIILVTLVAKLCWCHHVTCVTCVSTDDHGCTPLGRHCIATATCDNGTCVCPAHQHGDGTFVCIDRGEPPWAVLIMTIRWWPVSNVAMINICRHIKKCTHDLCLQLYPFNRRTNDQHSHTWTVH